jgi:hypothetical protein
MSEQYYYVLRDLYNDRFALCDVVKKAKGWWEIYTLKSYVKIDGVWKIRNYGPNHYFPILKGRTGPLHKIKLEDPDDDGPLIPTVVLKDSFYFTYSPLGPGDEEFAIVNSTTETFFQQLYS